jgi:hypothetical protein
MAHPFFRCLLPHSFFHQPRSHIPLGLHAPCDCIQGSQHFMPLLLSLHPLRMFAPAAPPWPRQCVRDVRLRSHESFPPPPGLLTLLLSHRLHSLTAGARAHEAERLPKGEPPPVLPQRRLQQPFAVARSWQPQQRGQPRGLDTFASLSHGFPRRLCPHQRQSFFTAGRIAAGPNRPRCASPGSEVGVPDTAPVASLVAPDRIRRGSACGELEQAKARE